MERVSTIANQLKNPIKPALAAWDLEGCSWLQPEGYEAGDVRNI
jgi:hypothetical protein